MTGRGLTDRCDASPYGTERATITWLRLRDDLELHLCAHHSGKYGARLAAVGFVPVPDGIDGATTVNLEGAPTTP